MARLKIKLTRNLRRSLLQGHPWVYREAIAAPHEPIERAQLCQVLDGKNELGWAIYDPHGALALRMLSTDSAPPTGSILNRRLARAWSLRKYLQSNSDTDAFRLFNGEGDLLPGMICDIYGTIAVLQFDGRGPGEFWDRSLISQWLLENTTCRTVGEKKRRGPESTPEGSSSLIHLGGEPCPNEVTIRENGARFKVNIEKGQKTGFFLDQRENRLSQRQVSKDQSVLNLFSYSGGFSVNSGLGQATTVASLDISQGALNLAQENWLLNDLKESQHRIFCVDVFTYLKDEKELWDHILVDPPSMGHSEAQKSIAQAKYIELFVAAIRRVRAQGQISLSSCTSHIAFADFFTIINEAMSQARRKGQILRVSGQGPDHPYPHSCPELRYLKFVHLALD